MNTPTTVNPPSSDPLRQQLRRDRQARVGILRNPNAPPRPPARRAALMGRWVNLRSSRRPPEREEDATLAHEVEESVAPLSVDDTLTRDEDGRVQSIDVDGLMATVDGLGTKAPVRAAFAAEYRHDIEKPKRETKQSAKLSVLSRDAWLDDDPDEEASVQHSQSDGVDHASELTRRKPWPLILGVCAIAGLGILTIGLN